MEKFSYEANGYNRAEVNQFVSDVISQTEGIIKKCQIQGQDVERLKQEVLRLNSELNRYKEMETTLKTAIIKAEETSDNIKRMAREESNILITDAKNNASRIVNEALLKAEKIETQADTLEKNMRIFKRKLKVIVEQQMAVVDEIEVLELEPK